LDFSTNSLSKYNTTLPFCVIAFASEGMRVKVQCYMFGHFSKIKGLLNY
jgi:hypothetical protein